MFGKKTNAICKSFTSYYIISKLQLTLMLLTFQCPGGYPLVHLLYKDHWRQEKNFNFAVLDRKHCALSSELPCAHVLLSCLPSNWSNNEPAVPVKMDNFILFTNAYLDSIGVHFIGMIFTFIHNNFHFPVWTIQTTNASK